MNIKVDQSIPSANHLLFADDVMVFTKVNVDHIFKIKDIMDHFEQFSGQTFNQQKCELFLGHKTHPRICKIIARCFHTTPSNKPKRILASHCIMAK